MKAEPNAAADFLPGLEIAGTLADVDRLTDAQLDERLPGESTAETIKKRRPDAYNAVVRLKYGAGLTQRQIAAAVNLNRRTVAAIIREAAGGAEARAFFLGNLNRLKALKAETLNQIEGLLADPVAVQKAGIAGLMTALNAISAQIERAEGAPTGEKLHQKNAEIIDSETLECLEE